MAFYFNPMYTVNSDSSGNVTLTVAYAAGAGVNAATDQAARLASAINALTRVQRANVGRIEFSTTRYFVGGYSQHLDTDGDAVSVSGATITFNNFPFGTDGSGGFQHRGITAGEAFQADQFTAFDSRDSHTLSLSFDMQLRNEAVLGAGKGRVATDRLRGRSFGMNRPDPRSTKPTPGSRAVKPRR